MSALFWFNLTLGDFVYHAPTKRHYTVTGINDGPTSRHIETLVTIADDLGQETDVFLVELA